MRKIVQTVYRKRIRCDSRHRPNAIFSNIASFALKAAGGEDWLIKRNIHHETSCIILSPMKVNMCVHKSVQYMTRTMEIVPVLYKTAGGQLRNKTEVHAALLAINEGFYNFTHQHCSHLVIFIIEYFDLI